ASAGQKSAASMFHHVAGWLRSEGRRHLSRQHWARWLGRNWARVSYGYGVEPTWLELNQLEVPVAGLPPAFAGFRIVQLSDFHGKHNITSDYLAEAVTLAQAQSADVVVLTGDFVHAGFRHVERVADVLGRLTAPCGVFAVLGN